MTLLDDEDDLGEAMTECFTALTSRDSAPPAARLWIAVLRRAIVALDRGAEDAYDVWAWIASRSDAIGAFGFICGELGFSERRWRRALLTMPRRPRGRPTVKRCAACQRKRWACPHGPAPSIVPPPEPMQATA